MDTPKSNVACFKQQIVLNILYDAALCSYPSQSPLESVGLDGSKFDKDCTISLDCRNLVSFQNCSIWVKSYSVPRNTRLSVYRYAHFQWVIVFQFWGYFRNSYLNFQNHGILDSLILVVKWSHQERFIALFYIYRSLKSRTVCIRSQLPVSVPSF